MRTQLPCVAVIATAVLLATRASAYSAWGSGSGSGYDDNTDCIRPPGAASGAGPTRNIADALLSARCLAVCLQEQQFHDGDFDVHTKQGYSYLSESDLESDCTVYNKVYECARGCVVGNSYPITTDCRQECTSQCASTSKDGSDDHGGCEKVCSYEECDNGCSYASSLAQSHSDERPAKPSTPLRLKKDSSTPVGVYAVNAPDEANWPVEPVSAKNRYVTFIIQVEEVEQAETYYIVKAGLPSKLSLAFLSCEEVFVYHSLVNEYGRSQFSPHTSKFLVEGVKVTQPTAVINVSISCIYDMRPGFFGHYCMKMTWINPTDPLSVSHFEVEIASYYNVNQCGTTVDKHVQPTPESPIQSTTLCATSQQSAPVSRCTYYATIYTIPAGSSFQTVDASTFVAVPDYEPDDLILDCVRWLNADNLFAVNLTIHLSEYLANERVVSSCVFLWTDDELLEDGTLDERTRISPYTKNFPEASSVLKETVVGLQPVAEDNVNYTVHMAPQWSLTLLYTPNTKIYTCSVNAQSLRPDVVGDISVSKLVVSRENFSFVVSVEWEEPNTFNGEFAKYELVVGPTAMPRDSNNIPTLSNISYVFNVDQTQLEVETLYHASFYCYYLQIRSANLYLPSNWSAPVVLAVDERCEYYDVIATPSMSSPAPVESQATSSSPMPSNETAQLQNEAVFVIIASLVILVAIGLVICVMIAMYCLGRRYKLSMVENQAIEVDDFNDIKLSGDEKEKSTSLQEVKPSEV